MQRITCRRYTDDFKAQAILLAESLGPAKAARQLDLSVKTLGNRLDASRAGRPLSSPSRKPDPAPLCRVSALSLFET
jgi:transposase